MSWNVYVDISSYPIFLRGLGISTNIYTVLVFHSEASRKFYIETRVEDLPLKPRYGQTNASDKASGEGGRPSPAIGL
jgi:hypothetical protein